MASTCDATGYVLRNKHITFKAFEQMEGFIHGYTKGYDESGKDFDFSRSNPVVRALNIDRAGRDIGFDPKTVVTVRQMHTDLIRMVTKDDVFANKDDAAASVYDAMITNEKGITLATVHADCVPVFMIDPVKKCIGLAHSGWKGTLASIGVKTLAAMHRAYRSNPKDVVCVIGPSICKSCYEVQEDVAEQFKRAFSWANAYVLKTGSSYRLDLKGVVKETLKQAGVPESRLHECCLCTMCNPGLLYSHRGSQGAMKRSLAFLGIAGRQA